MQDKDVIAIYTLLEEAGIDVWIDGGWGVDALLEKQTRPHNDLDIAVRHKDVKRLRGLLTEKGYKEIKQENTKEWNFILRKDNKEVDVHVFDFDDKGNNIYGIQYPKESLTGIGLISGKSVKCISVKWVIQFHEAYEPKEKEIKDIKALVNKFGVNPPKSYNLLFNS